LLGIAILFVISIRGTLTGLVDLGHARKIQGLRSHADFAIYICISTNFLTNDHPFAVSRNQFHQAKIAGDRYVREMIQYGSLHEGTSQGTSQVLFGARTTKQHAKECKGT
jgi:hypothetical protein